MGSHPTLGRPPILYHGDRPERYPFSHARYAIFEGTLHHISEEGMRRFNRRMCGDKETFNRYSELSPRPLEEIKEELESLYNQILPEKLESADPRISTFWDQAILSTEDKIFPATNLRNYW